MSKWEYLKREIPITNDTMRLLNTLGDNRWKLEFMGACEHNEEGGVSTLYCIFMRPKEANGD